MKILDLEIVGPPDVICERDLPSDLDCTNSVFVLSIDRGHKISSALHFSPFEHSRIQRSTV